MLPTKHEGGTTPELVLPSSKMVDERKGAQASDLLSYPFMANSFFSAGSTTQNGFLGGSTFQDLVLQACSDTHMQATNMVDQDHPCTLDSSHIANMVCSDGGVVENVEESVEVPSTETDADMGIELVPSEAIQDISGISGLNGEQDLQPLPKWKRLPKDAPDMCQTLLMSPIEKALRNAPSKKTKYIFEPTPGTKFNCLTEAQEFYNLYSWEVGFGTKKGDKREGRMQEFHCQCKGSDNRVQYKTVKKNCPAMVRLHRTLDLGWYITEHRADHNHPLSESCGEKLCWRSHGNIDQYTQDMIRYLRDDNVTLAKVNHVMGKLIGPVGI